MSNELIGKEYREFDGKKRWELLYEDMWLVIFDTGLKKGCDVNLVGISTGDARVKWAVGGSISDGKTYDGIVNVYVKDGHVCAGTWSGVHYKLDHKTGEILEQKFLK